MPCQYWDAGHFDCTEHQSVKVLICKTLAVFSAIKPLGNKNTTFQVDNHIDIDDLITFYALQCVYWPYNADGLIDLLIY